MTTPKERKMLMEEAFKQIGLATTRRDAVTVATRWAGELMKQGATDNEFKALNAATQERLEEVEALRPTGRPAPRVVKGHYIAPTPVLGKRVIWLQNGDVTRRFPADVVVIEDVGRLQLRIIKAKGDAHVLPDHVMGVYHVSNPIHEQQGNQQSVRCGAWEYLDGEEISERDYMQALEALDKKTARAAQAVAQETARAAAIQQQEQLNKRRESEDATRAAV